MVTGGFDQHCLCMVIRIHEAMNRNKEQGKIRIMSKHRLVPILSAVGVFLIGAAAPQTCPALLVANSFDTDPGWTGVNNRDGFYDYGWTNTAVAGGAAGEVGGRFQRRGYDSYYADTASFAGGSFSLGDSFSASGKWDVTDHAAQNSSILIGHLSAGGADKSFIGLESFEASGGGASNRTQAVVILSDGTKLTSVTDGTPGAFQLVFTDADNWFGYTYNPTGGAFTQGQLTLTVTNSVQSYAYTVDLMAANRATGATFGAWGMYAPPINNTTEFFEAYMDDVIYSVPEPTSVALLLAGGAVLAVWRRGREIRNPKSEARIKSE